MTTEILPEGIDYDYLIIGGGTAGCVIADRISEALPDKKVLMIEGGPSDINNNDVLYVKEWVKLLQSELDLDYLTTEQPNGNSTIRHARARVLGGCSSHNTLISFFPPKHDIDRWVAAGCEDWDFETMKRLVNKLKVDFLPVAAKDRNPIVEDWIQSASKGNNIPVVTDFNKGITENKELLPGVGFLSVAYKPDSGKRNSASTEYIHPILEGYKSRPNLTILTDAWVTKVVTKDNVAVGVDVTLKGEQNARFVGAKKEVVLCCGAIDTPRLMLLSGMGPKEELERLDIEVTADIPGVGENLMDHPEGVVIWELKKEMPKITSMDLDSALFINHQFPGEKDDAVDLMIHSFGFPFTWNTEPLGYPSPPDGWGFCATPNVPQPRSKGKIYLTSKDPKVNPALDFRYFTDPEGYDAAILVAGIKTCRKAAAQEPFKSWIKEEVAPGPQLQTDEELNEFARRSANTVYHPSGTTKMGNVSKDRLAVVDTRLKVRGFKNLRVADAGIFPEITTVNPMLTVLAIGERASELIVEDASITPNL